MRLAACILLFTAATANAQTQRAIVEFDHATDQATLITHGRGGVDTLALGEDPVVRLGRGVPVEVRVVNTNTALYRFSRSSVTTPLPETQSLQSFMGRVQPYLPELRSALSRGRGGAVDPAEAAAEREARAASVLAMQAAVRSTNTSLARIDAALFGERGLQANLTAGLLALERMRGGMAPEAASEPLRRALGLGAACQPEHALRHRQADQLLVPLAELAESTQLLRSTLTGTSYAPDSSWLAVRAAAAVAERRAQAALADFEPLVTTAYRVERLVAIVASACSRWSGGTVKGTLTSGREITVTVEPRTEVETARLIDRTARSYTVTVQPRALLRPAIALGGVGVPAARFPTYSTRPVADGVEIYQSGRKDARFALAGSLGFTWPGLDRREERGYAIWLPEVVVTGGGSMGIGVGSALSLSFLKLGAGAMWIRHSALDGVRAGDVVADESRLVMSESFGSPRFYVSLGIFDWAPFARHLPVD